MKQLTTLKKMLLAACIAGAGVANGQIHPLAFGPFPYGGADSDPNWYKDYVGMRFLVNSPAPVAGDKVYTFAGSGSTPWGATTASISNVQICMPPLGGDTLAAAAFPSGSMAGKIGYVYRGGGIEFVCKARRCMEAGAIAVVIVNNQTGGPIGMGAGSVCLTTGLESTPVFMISKEDGDAITAQYRAGDTARLTITQWGLNLAHDAGFVPGGIANWHAYAIPGNQLQSSGNPFEYKMVDGAFIANYGTANLTNVKVNVSTSFTPTGGTPSVVHTNTLSLTSFPVADSIYAMFANSEYDLTPSGKGRYDVKYDIYSPDMADDNPADNSMTSTFYVTDSTYSKGRYDFATNSPMKTISNSFNGGDGFVWGPMYYVKNGGTALSRVQYSMSFNGTGPLGSSATILLFKWTDGTGGTADSIVQNGELELKSVGTHNYDGVLDTSGANLNFWGMGDVDGNPATIMLEANSWYYLAVAVPPAHFLGADGVFHPYPRIFGRFQLNNSVLDYSSMVNLSKEDIVSTPAAANTPLPGAFISFVNSIDSVNYANTRGLLPAVAMIVNNDPVSVPNSPVANNNKVSLFPNPASDKLNVTVALEKASKKVTYLVLDGLGRQVSRFVHDNVTTENFAINTADYVAGNYYLVISTDEKAMARKFVVAK